MKKSLSSSKTFDKKKSARSALGAPSQLKQSSRKGKRAWRKNVDLQEVEEGVESLRAEERITGSTLQSKKNEDLFQIDVEGDDKVRKSLPRFSKDLLTSTKILSQRSAVPAVFSRAGSTGKFKSGLTRDDKLRLLRMGKRARKGPFNSIMDPTEFGAGSALLDVSHAVKNSGGYDPWAEPEAQVDGEDAWVQPKKPVNQPKLSHPREAIELPAVMEPHQGTSYNPPVFAHEDLVLQAFKEEQQRLKEIEKLAEVKKRIDAARDDEHDTASGVPQGMFVDEGQVDATMDNQQEENCVVPAKQAPERKTKQQRAKAARLKAEKLALAEKAARKRMLGMISSAKSIRLQLDRTARAREHAQLQRECASKEKLKKGLAGQKLGKHKVPKNEIDVQLGEDLSENFRTLKPEGNLFRDRFRSLQQRALIEPRVPVLPTRRKFKMKEYEKHAWKRFQ